MNETEQQEFDELRKSLHIHIHELHKDAQAQPDLVCRAGELAAEMKARSKRAKLAVEETKANVDKSIRDNPDEHGLAKVTEGAVQSTIDRCVEVKKAQNEAIDAELESDKAAVLAEAYRHRKGMISDEVTLYVANYWGEVDERQMGKTASDAKGQQDDRVQRKRRRLKKNKEKENEVEK